VTGQIAASAASEPTGTAPAAMRHNVIRAHLESGDYKVGVRNLIRTIQKREATPAESMRVASAVTM